MFSATKALWLLRSIPDGIERAARGELCVGTVDSWMVWNLTGGSVFATDVSNASRTLLLDIASGAWSSDMLDVFGIPVAALPQVRLSKDNYGCTRGTGVLPDGIPVASAIGDSHAALFGHCAFEPGAVKATYGTGSSLMTVTGSPIVNDFGLSTTVAWGGVDGQVTHALEGNILATGSAVQWFGEFLGCPDPAKTVAAMADSVASSEGVYVVPAFVGLGAPHWSPSARAIITGISRGTTAAHVARAVLDSIAYQICDVFELMERESGQVVEALLTDGGASANDSLMQFQADIIGRRVVRSTSADLSARGAAWLAGLQTGFWRSLYELRSLPDETTLFEPRMDSGERNNLRHGWRRAVAQTLYTAKQSPANNRPGVES
jgi:glycerol kinase